jgi:hypothetical protein
MLLTQLYFYVEHPDVQPYVDRLPFGLAPADMQNLRDTDIALMRAEFGLELHFGGVKSMDAIAMTASSSSATARKRHALGRARCRESSSFDDSPEVTFRKMAQPPDNKTEEEFVGYALWHQPEYSLQLKYSTMFNWIVKSGS